MTAIMPPPIVEIMLTRDPATIVKRADMVLGEGAPAFKDCEHCGVATRYIFGRRDAGELVFSGRFCGLQCYERAERAKGLR